MTPRDRIGFLGLFFIVWNLWVVAPAEALPGDRTEALVTRVIDGDTFEIESKDRVRMIGMNTPEYEPWKGRRDFYGREAADFSRALLKGKRVLLEEDAQERDKYGRLLAYVYLDGEMINRRLVLEGYAKARSYPPNLRYQKLFRDAEKTARSGSKGVWSENNGRL